MATIDGHRGPDFIIAGAPRSATTWLYYLADSHPQIAMAKPARPEPKFFLIDSLYERGLEYYCKTWFDALPPNHILGEKSTNYLENAAVAERIHSSLPNVKLVFLVRNPVDRAFSNFLWSKQNGLENLDFATALELEGERERDTPANLLYARPFAYFSRGLYADLLLPFFNRFSREQILVLRTEDVAAEPQDVASRFFEFVGVRAERQLADTLGTVNAATVNGTILDPHLREALEKRYREPNERLRVLLGQASAVWAET